MFVVVHGVHAIGNKELQRSAHWSTMNLDGQVDLIHSCEHTPQPYGIATVLH